ncbi:MULTISPECIES: alpha/beta fold hydrolase [unclassified Pseudomonas]|uniref:thioesterase II family protein n=1 Tax=unclassified Pseudomonas TaxID=196821 RepID=UPI00083924C7|nr:MULTISPECIES: alpha/beta fold hydrolase [unclassified Pseudomonas]QIH11023.1 thioesterase [Pseudomonas sp. BIOMIG1BAC]
MATASITQPRWLAPLSTAPCREGQDILLCFPYGGGGSSAFHGLEALRYAGITPWVVKLPGREERIQEPAATCIHGLIDAIVEALQAFTRPLAFYGHSFGAGLALDVAHALVERGCQPPTRLVLSGRMPPHTGYSPLLGAMDDEQLWQHVCAESALPLPRDASCGFARQALVKLKADLVLNAQLTYRFIRPLPIPLYTLNGLDDPLIDTHRLDEWQRYSSIRYQGQCLPGGHFFFEKDFQRFYATLLTTLTEQDS